MEAQRIFGFDQDAPSFTTEEVESCMIERERVHQALIDLIANDTPYDLEYDIITKNTGERRTIISLAEIERDESGNPVNVHGVIRDVTESKKAANALLKSERLLNEMGALAKIGGWEHDLVTHEATWTRETYRIVEFECGPIPGPNEHLSYYPPEDRAIIEKAYTRAVETGAPFDIEVQCNTAKGRLFWARVIGHPTLRNGRCVKMSGTFQDITERKKLEERLQQAQKLEAIGVLAGGIAHDFNNILSAILGFTELARKSEPSNQQLQEDLNEIYTAGNRAKELVQQILTFSRRRKHTPCPLHIPGIVKEVAKLQRSTLPASIELVLAIDENVRPVLADATQIHQIVMNLCSNAGHAMEDNGGVLTIKVSEITPPDQFFESHPNLTPGSYIEMIFQDTGTGIAPQMMGSIFDPYFTTKNYGDGTGLGLAVTYGIVRKIGGEIRAESELGKGSIFTLLLPITERRVHPLESSHLSDFVPSRGHERILLVDDEPQFLKLTRRILEKYGHTVTTARDGRSAFEKFVNNPLDFDLVISDVGMPRLSGDKLAAQILAVLPTMRVLLTSGNSQKISEEMVVKAGVKGLLNKPVSEEQFMRKVRQVLDEN
jgi:signal transduction histidine kinase/CheY-like chemotaxis protein